MSYFAEIDKDGIVKRVIVAEQGFINSGSVGNPKNWIQTSYNTRGGIHKLGGVPLRKNYAGVGWQYDKNRDAFIPPKSFNSWTLNEDDCIWKAPKPCPGDGRDYRWDEDRLDWVIREVS